ncbi:MAG TPA: DUF3857 domain-containing protein [Pyrinomonadaceae bacterium]|nr:DUF3857 domain-containing protein [Pyrinomonadaceae bacterium]
MKLRFVTVLSFLLLLVAPAHAMAGDDVPTWVQQAAALKVPAYDKDVTAVVLVDDSTTNVDAQGYVTEVYKYAVRILKREGREYAEGGVGYIPESAKIKDFRGWLVRPSGDAKRYGKDETIDLAGADNDVYNEYRMKQIKATSDADAGMVFAYTYTREDKSVFSQADWKFQSSIPVINSRFNLVLPAGWRAEGVTFNHAKIEPQVNGSTYTWELSNLEALADEPLSPSLSNLAARLAVSYYPPAGQTAAIKTFGDWAAVAGWVTELSDSQVVVNDALARKAYELTALAKTEFDKIRAIAQYVQNIQYISIQTGIGRGGGYRPHSSTEVFAKSYGDCKDKANLMRAMLKVVGITAFPVSIYSGDPEYVKPEWPSPQQFNHCIIAVKVSDQTQAETIVRDAALGRLMIFDPTDSETPLGDLPSYLQGSLALINSKESKELIRMPVTPPETNQLERNATLALRLDGALTGSIQEQAKGQTAARFRTEFRRLARPEYNSMVERWVTAGAAAATLEKIEPSDGVDDGRFSLKVEFSTNTYGQLMQGRLLVFKPAVVSRRDYLALTAPQRKYPVVLQSSSYSETARFKLPAGFDVDELPEAVKLEAAFGTYATSYEVKEGELIFKRTFLQRAMTIPATSYESVRSFFERIRAAEQAPVVLARK